MSLCYQDGLAYFTPFIPLLPYIAPYISPKKGQWERLSRWSRTSIAREIRTILKQMGRRAPSARTVGRWLKAERLRPWRYHSWQHLHDLESFLVRPRPVLEAYPQAKALLTHAIWFVCMAEKTTIQARH